MIEDDLNSLQGLHADYWRGVRYPTDEPGGEGEDTGEVGELGGDDDLGGDEGGDDQASGDDQPSRNMGPSGDDGLGGSVIPETVSHLSLQMESFADALKSDSEVMEGSIVECGSPLDPIDPTSGLSLSELVFVAEMLEDFRASKLEIVWEIGWKE